MKPRHFFLLFAIAFLLASWMDTKDAELIESRPIQVPHKILDRP